MGKPKVAVIGTGGTIAGQSNSILDMFEYAATGRLLEIEELLAKFPIIHTVAEIVPIKFKTVLSTAIAFREWKQMLVSVDAALKEHSDLAGVVVLHGTATLEETAYALSLTSKAPIPIVIAGAQRPSSALSSDAGLNLVNAIRTASAPEARELGVLVCLNDEIQAAREVTKTSTMRMQTFRSPDFGVLGHADGDAVTFYRKPIRRSAPNTEFDIRQLDNLPRVDVAYAYAGDDGTAIKAFVAAGARGLVMAGFPPGTVTPQMLAALREARAAGLVVVMSSRAAGRIYSTSAMRDAELLTADNLTPQKARILLALALTKTTDLGEVHRMFATY
jgi:L-asparaginase